MPKNVAAEYLDSLLSDVLSNAYREEVEQFMFDLVVALVNGRDRAAAIAAAEAQAKFRPSDGHLDIVFERTEDFLAVRGHTDLLIDMADSSQVSKILLRLKSEEGKAAISPKLRRRKTRKTNMATGPIIALPGVQMAQMRFTERPVLDGLMHLLFDFLENPEKACGVVALSTQQQIVITEASARMILQSDFDRLMEDDNEAEIRRKVAQATRLKREDYFYSEDLLEFMAMTRELEPNNPDSVRELRWRGIARNGEHFLYIHKYKLAEFGGQLFHIGENVASEPIEAPAVPA